jgi:dipeptidyl aminopeptidase/acylaminoacyl peptidase
MRWSIPLLILFALPCAADPEVAQANAPALPVLGDQGPIDALRLYQVPAERFAVQLGELDQHQYYSKREVAFPSALKERWSTIHGTYYAPVGLKPGEQVPAAVVVHHLGGSFDAEAFLAQHLAQHGVAAFFISLPNYGKRQEQGTRQGFLRMPPRVAFSTFRQAALDVIRAGDFLRSRPEVDPERVGAVGVSLGAFVTAVARGVDPRLQRTVLILGGGDLHGMFTTIPEGSRLLDESGVDPRTLPEILKPVDPLTFASRVDPADVLMLNARNDEIVPEASALALWEALKQPKIRWFRCGHYGVVLHVLTVMNATLDHLKG